MSGAKLEEYQQASPLKTGYHYALSEALWIITKSAEDIMQLYIDETLENLVITTQLIRSQD